MWISAENLMHTRCSMKYPNEKILIRLLPSCPSRCRAGAEPLPSWLIWPRKISSDEFLIEFSGFWWIFDRTNLISVPFWPNKHEFLAENSKIWWIFDQKLRFLMNFLKNNDDPDEHLAKNSSFWWIFLKNTFKSCLILMIFLKNTFKSCLILMIIPWIWGSDTNCKSQKHVNDPRNWSKWIKVRNPMINLWV